MLSVVECRPLVIVVHMIAYVPVSEHMSCCVQASEDNPHQPSSGVKIVVSPENDTSAASKKPACCGG